MLADLFPEGEQDLDAPKVIKENELYELHFKLDDTLNQPKDFVILERK